MPPPVIRLTRVPDQVAVCRLAPDTPIADWMVGGALASVTRTPHELSVVVDVSRVPAAVRQEGPFAVFMVDGPLDFSLTGILARLTLPLAEAAIPVFVVSTYDTDYVLVRDHQADSAVAAWRAVGGLAFT